MEVMFRFSYFKLGFKVDINNRKIKIIIFTVSSKCIQELLFSFYWRSSNNSLLEARFISVFCDEGKMDITFSARFCCELSKKDLADFNFSLV